MSIGREFVRKTTYPHLGPSDQQRGVPMPPLCDQASRASRVIALPPPCEPSIGLVAAMRSRRSVRRYADIPLSLPELSFLLWSSQGVRQRTDTATQRTVPSAGSRHAFETVILANRVEGLQSGLYQFLACDGALSVLSERAGISEDLCAACRGQMFVSSAAAVFFWVAVPARMVWRYGERGYRYLFLDAGHVCQNLYLAAEAISCGACAIGAYSDDDVNRLLGLDGDERFVLYAAAVGKKEEQRKED